MKRIEYRLHYSNANRDPAEEVVAMFARDINSGFRKATDYALRDLAPKWELLKVEFWQVTS